MILMCIGNHLTNKIFELNCHALVQNNVQYLNTERNAQGSETQGDLRHGEAQHVENCRVSGIERLSQRLMVVRCWSGACWYQQNGIIAQQFLVILRPIKRLSLVISIMNA